MKGITSFVVLLAACAVFLAVGVQPQGSKKVSAALKKQMDKYLFDLDAVKKAASVLSIQSACETPPPVNGIVTRSGTSFVVDGKPIYFAGTNAFYLPMPHVFSEGELVNVLEQHACQGATVLRLFAFSNGDGKEGGVLTPEPIQPTLGEFQESALKRLDFVLAEGGKVGLRFILCLSNYWPFLGGIQWWVDQVKGTGFPQEDFYRDDRVIDAFTTFVTKLVTRTNVYTGQAYKDDPAIFAWNLQNEPHTTDLYERNRGLQPGSSVMTWADKMSSYIKNLDPNHMVSTGEEGYSAGGDTSGRRGSWINGGYKGVDFEGNTALQHIDFATVHVYPDSWEFTTSDSDMNWLRDNFLQDRLDIATRLGKPIIIEEYGVRPYFFGSRQPFFDRIHRWSAEIGFAGTLVWQAWHAAYNSTEMFTDYNFAYNQEGGSSITWQYNYMKSKTEGTTLPPLPEVAPSPACDPACSDVTPGTLYTCAQQVGWEKCSEAWMEGFCNASCRKCVPC